MPKPKKKRNKCRHRINEIYKNVCIVPSCKEKAKAVGFCDTHCRSARKGYIRLNGKKLEVTPLKPNTANGNTKHPLYHVWRGMKERCYNPKSRPYEWYGGKGVRVDIEWFVSFRKFVEDVGERPQGFELDRIDGNKNYEPDNTRWVEQKENLDNRNFGNKYF